MLNEFQPFAVRTLCQNFVKRYFFTKNASSTASQLLNSHMKAMRQSLYTHLFGTPRNYKMNKTFPLIKNQFQIRPTYLLPVTFKGKFSRKISSSLLCSWNINFSSIFTVTHVRLEIRTWNVECSGATSICYKYRKLISTWSHNLFPAPVLNVLLFCYISLCIRTWNFELIFFL